MITIKIEDNQELLLKFFEKKNIEYIELDVSKYKLFAKDIILLYKFRNKCNDDFDFIFKVGHLKKLVVELMEEKAWDEIKYLHDKKYYSQEQWAEFFYLACEDYDIETTSYMCSFVTKSNINKALLLVCLRNDDNVDMTRFILEQISKPDNKLLNNAMNSASYAGNINIARLLIDYGVDLDDNDKAIEMAIEEDNLHMHMVYFLLEHGAKINNSSILRIFIQKNE